MSFRNGWHLTYYLVRWIVLFAGGAILAYALLT
jgi:hypothetical protein